MSRSPSLGYNYNHYQILSLPSPRSGVSPSLDDIKQAYRDALLRYHPDKSMLSEHKPEAKHQDEATHSIDHVILAYKTLSNTSARAAYDNFLRHTESWRPHSTTPQGTLHSGFETVDLDDLSHDTEDNSWYRGCRCGDQKGFQVTETDLEQRVTEGAVMTGCRGCSLWLQVEFAVSNGENQAGEIMS